MSRLGIIDTHAHLDDNRFDADRDQVMARLGADMEAVINQGTNGTTNAASIALAVKAWLPSISVAVANDQAPLPLAVAVPICVAPSNTCTVLPAAAVPLRVS